MSAPPQTRFNALQNQARRPPNMGGGGPVANPVVENASQMGIWAKYKWWIIGLVVILAIVGGVLGGVLGKPHVSVHINKCAGGTPGVGTNKEKGCLCNSASECTSGICSTSATTLVAGASQGKCT